ncbi:MAG: phosphatidylcholine/phosphatidylserine synthase [Methylobacterium sp.]|jgi:CDP-diacylglycerol--serine O-phosphatidyltransferase|nr:phosphatidylcholine/phosphatidylserine synthase [Methylobacterium sp.]MCE2933652.1 phosphatidylcholine/phosphatidylserine synthase [Hyphomicrobiales bacterium]MCA3634669.1 phosphatidylcholine/phosphatidylserine synthase [Methylobacterium sp.]MCA3639241.1 phosphatidylcholine/phosphatidylserine synthase [Methylobacterium sp.]MCA3642692.1 phosphatidylcholine/phosphatidylserine synthase [Methylobacterium sp.]
METIFPPYEPEPTPPQRRFRPVPIRMLIPNLVTLLALAAGLTAVKFALEGRYDMASISIMVAAVLDGLDGRIARALGGTSRFGAELDSLADFVSFGCAPALVLYMWVMKDVKTAGWIAGLVLAFAQALRLARFNVMIDSPAKPEWQKAFAVGVPAPSGAMMALLPLNLHLAGMPSFAGESIFVMIWTVLTGILAVSWLPTFSGKGLKTPISRQWAIPLLLLAGIVILLLVSHPFETVSALTLAYVACLPVSARAYLRRKRQDEAPHLANPG